LALVPLGLGLSAISAGIDQQPPPGGQPAPSKPEPPAKPDQPPKLEPPGKEPSREVNRAKEMADLIKQGQLTLRDATDLAEKHVKGTALEAACEIKTGEMKAGSPAPKDRPMPPTPPGGGDAVQDPKPGDPPDPMERKPGEMERAGGKRLIYEVRCFANEKIQVAQVDGMTKKVIDVKEHGSLTRSGGSMP
jgi:hypothetical protein